MSEQVILWIMAGMGSIGAIGFHYLVKEMDDLRNDIRELRQRTQACPLDCEDRD